MDLIGPPPGRRPRGDAALRRLELRGVGPAAVINYEPSDRINIISGDNSLGKTFLLDCIWWALTGQWVSHIAWPRMDSPQRHPLIRVVVGTSKGTRHSFVTRFDWERQEWDTVPEREILTGLAVYARYDGSFAVWDPARPDSAGSLQTEALRYLALSREEVWDGAIRSGRQLCNGLYADLVLWQVGGDRYGSQFAALSRCLQILSPSDDEPLQFTDPTRLAESRELPTLRMPYGDVPLKIASAAVRRIVALAYMLVWTWFEHLQNARAARRPPQQALVLVIDEVEAHLHPRWQRLIIPAIVQAVESLAHETSTQVHVATHSPMVMASAETIFDETRDDLHHLRVDGRDVTLEELPFVRRGTSDAWLASDVFGLGQPRSREAERAIDDAKQLQLSDAPNRDAVRTGHDRLVQYLAPDDEFWPRWRFFAKQHGVK